MIEIRFHGRGGQGAVIGGKILASAVFLEGKFVQAFPNFGVERRGVPVTAFVRVDDGRINLRCQIYNPDHLIILDPTLANSESTFEGFKGVGWVLINTRRAPDDLARKPAFSGYRIATVDASAIASRNDLGTPMSPIVNTAILGAFARITRICTIDSICHSIAKGVPMKAEANAKAAREAYEEVRYIQQHEIRNQKTPTS